MNRTEIRKILKEKNTTMSMMAEEIGTTVQRLSDIFGGRMPGWKYRRRISQYLGVDEEILFPDDGEEHQSCQT